MPTFHERRRDRSPGAGRWERLPPRTEGPAAVDECRKFWTPAPSLHPVLADLLVDEGARQAEEAGRLGDVAAGAADRLANVLGFESGARLAEGGRLILAPGGTAARR